MLLQRSISAIFLFLVLFAASPAPAQTAIAPIETAAREAYLIDANTGTTLYAKEGNTRMVPSSMSKLMTMYVVFEAIRNGKMKLDEELPVSEHAWKQEGSRMFLNVNQKAKVEDLIRGVIVQSGNDASVVLAEALGGSEQGFAEQLNAKAQKLGLTGSHFVNSTGLPDPEHYSTAHDLALVSYALIRDFPEDYHYFSEKEFAYNNIKQGNRNPLLYRNMDVDGLKTGHTESGGFGLAASALRNGRRLVLVLNGMTNMQERADESAKMLDWGYREFGLYPVVKAGSKVADAEVWLGEAPAVALVIAENLELTLPRAARSGLKLEITYDQPVPAPIRQGQPLGKLTVTAPGMEPKEIALHAANDIPKVGFMAEIKAKLRQLIDGKS
ncbi:MAG: D-alanyl-D-alanine carboxypeptidase family protein [Bdellovibrionales bacterium]